ncbi:MAG TPA: ThiF family adenylyltransferase [Chthonomonadaceae bacterium]|nr:ThiF family adenylyltransferase [Chthonomonadaceae bacterium]
MLASVSIVGCGNIGGPLCDLIGRLPAVGRLTLIDADSYTEANLRGQAIGRAEIGMPKAVAMARRLRRIRPELRIDAHHAAVEELPIGVLRSSVICACLDSRVSRMAVNTIAFRLGVPWIDAGVLASEMLARVDVFVPGDRSPCLECAFGERHYATMEARHPCTGARSAAAPTNAPAFLGALAASLQAAECDRLLREAAAGAPFSGAGVQTMVGLDARTLVTSRNRRNISCKFDHEVYSPQCVPPRVSLKRLLGEPAADPPGAWISSPGQRFVEGAECARCGSAGPAFRRLGPGAAPVETCGRCGACAPLHPGRLHERISAAALSPTLQCRPPSALGLRPGDLFTISDSRGARHYLLGSATSAGGRG